VFLAQACAMRSVLAVAAAFADCDGVEGHGPFSSSFHNATWNGTLFYAQVPAGDGPFPTVLFMHGLTAEYGMYQPNLELYSSHGLLVVYPFIKDPAKDKEPFTTNTDGKFLIKALEYVEAAKADAASPLYGKVGADHAFVGHSMGATCSIRAAASHPGAKVVITQHPGICGPFGPPPWPSTWMPDELAQANRVPLIFTTATNDGAFWPAPHTAEHEFGCFGKAKVPGPAAFVQFSAAACDEDHERKPYSDSGHNCAFKAHVETPWVLRALKHYLQGAEKCGEMLWGTGPDSLKHVNTTDKVVLVHPEQNVLV